MESFATAIAQILREMKQDDAKALWNRWLLKYLKQRARRSDKFGHWLSVFPSVRAFLIHFFIV
jgi:hypothetical protein